MAAVSSIVSAVATTVDDAASILEGIQRIAGVLNTPRSVVLVVENYTKRQLTRIWHHHAHGGFAVTPSTIIDPKGVNIYGSQNKAMSIGTGTEGGVMYQLEGDDKLGFYLYWKNAFIKTKGNQCGAFMCTVLSADVPAGVPPLFLPYLDDAFKVVSTCGVGNQAAEMRFELMRDE
jgi:hypothetical protein